MTRKQDASRKIESATYLRGTHRLLISHGGDWLMLTVSAMLFVLGATAPAIAVDHFLRFREPTPIALWTVIGLLFMLLGMMCCSWRLVRIFDLKARTFTFGWKVFGIRFTRTVNASCLGRILLNPSSVEQPGRRCVVEIEVRHPKSPDLVYLHEFPGDLERCTDFIRVVTRFCGGWQE
jgi:hypothetical protein